MITITNNGRVKMQAVVMEKAGDTSVLKLVTLDEPQITNKTQVKIKIQAAGVNPIDTKVRSLAMFYPEQLPAVLGCDLAGEVIEVGAAVKKFKIGDRVWACQGGLGNEQGNYAEYTVIEQRWLALMPKGETFMNAAAAPLVLITAWGALFERGHLQAGETVLIHAGAGGVGHVAIQLAKTKGARVITTVSNAEKAALVKALGADEVINYREENVLHCINKLTNGQGVDLSFDTVGGDVFSQSIALTAHYGRLVTLLDPGQCDLSEARMRNLQIGFELMLTPMLRGLNKAHDQQIRILEQCADLMEQGKLQIKVMQTFDLENIQQAHKLIEEGHSMGKLVLKC